MCMRYLQTCIHNKWTLKYFWSVKTLRQLHHLFWTDLVSVVPVTLGNLTRLVSLNLSRNSLTGSVPSSLGELSSLSELDFSRNTLTGARPPSFSSLLRKPMRQLAATTYFGQTCQQHNRINHVRTIENHIVEHQSMKEAARVRFKTCHLTDFTSNKPF